MAWGPGDVRLATPSALLAQLIGRIGGACAADGRYPSLRAALDDLDTRDEALSNWVARQRRNLAQSGAPERIQALADLPDTDSTAQATLEAARAYMAEHGHRPAQERARTVAMARSKPSPEPLVRLDPDALPGGGPYVVTPGVLLRILDGHISTGTAHPGAADQGDPVALWPQLVIGDAYTSVHLALTAACPHDRDLLRLTAEIFGAIGLCAAVLTYTRAVTLSATIQSLDRTGLAHGDRHSLALAMILDLPLLTEYDLTPVAADSGVTAIAVLDPTASTPL